MFNLLWHHVPAARHRGDPPAPEDPPQLPSSLIQHDGGRLAFQETTDRIIQALGIRTGQRLDSTHIMSNIATLTRLGLFPETHAVVPAGLALGAPRASPWGSRRASLVALPEGRRRGTHTSDAPHGGGSATPFGVPGTSTAGGPVPWHDVLPSCALVPAAGSALREQCACGQTPGRAPQG